MRVSRPGTGWFHTYFLVQLAEEVFLQSNFSTYRYLPLTCCPAVRVAQDQSTRGIPWENAGQFTSGSNVQQSFSSCPRPVTKSKAIALYLPHGTFGSRIPSPAPSAEGRGQKTCQ